MTVSTTTNKITYTGNGATTSFSFPFPGVSASDIQVYYTDTSGNITLINPSLYTVTLNAAVAPNPTGIGGTVNYPLSGSPIAASTLLTIIRTMPLTQPTSLTNQGTLWQGVVEAALDDLLLQIQQLNELLGRQITVAVSDSNPAALPPAAQRANQWMYFNASGDPIATSAPTGSTPISSIMAPVVASASLAAARSALGLGNIALENIGAALQDDGSGNVRPIFVTSSVSGAKAVTSADYLKHFKNTGPNTWTLPRANTLWNGFGFWVENLIGGGNLTIAIDSHDTIENGSSGVSFIIPQGVSFYISTNAAVSGTWWLELAVGYRASAPPVGTFKNLAIDVASTSTVTASADSLVVSDGIYSYTIAPSATINFAVNGVNGLDAGSIASGNKDYFIWAIYNPITQQSGWIASLQSTANATFLANLAANAVGYTAYGRYGAVKSAAGTATLMGTKQRGRRTQYVVGLASTTLLPLMQQGPVGTYGGAGAPVWAPVAVANFVPATASVIRLMAWPANYKNLAGTGSIQVAPNNSYKGYGDANGNSPPYDNQSGNGGCASFDLMLESANIYAAMSSNAQALACEGWEDNI